MRLVTALILSLAWGPGAWADCDELFKRAFNRATPVEYQVNIDRVRKRIESYRETYRNQLTVREIARYDGHPLYRVDLPGRGPGPKRRILITAGVHGNESVGSVAALRLIEDIVHDSALRERFDVVVFPALNSAGLAKNSRALNNGKDLNRGFKGRRPGPARALADSVKGERFDLGLDLHEAYTRDGFFVISAQDGDEKLVRSVLGEVDSRYLLHSPGGAYPHDVHAIGTPNKVAYVLTSPGHTSSTNKGTVKSFFANTLKIPYAYTIESSGKVALDARLDVYGQLLKSFLRHFP